MSSMRVCVAAAAGSRGAVESGGLTQLQLQRLRQAASAGRRHVEVKTLCKETGLDRRFVLHWLKLNADSAAETSDNASADSLSVPPTASSRRSPRPQEGAEAREASAGSASWGRPGRRYSKAVEDTLEMVFEETSHPPDAVVAGIMELHRLPRRQVLDWFIERRRLGRTPSRIRRAVPPKVPHQGR